MLLRVVTADWAFDFLPAACAPLHAPRSPLARIQLRAGSGDAPEAYCSCTDARACWVPRRHRQKLGQRLRLTCLAVAWRLD
jgi:hypothetical protein